MSMKLVQIIETDMGEKVYMYKCEKCGGYITTTGEKEPATCYCCWKEEDRNRDNRRTD